MRTTRHSLMAKGILVLLSLLILVFIFTYSWFLPPDHPATASGLSFSTESSASFDVAIGFVTPDTNEYVFTDFTDDSTNTSLDFSNLVVPSSFSINLAGNTSYDVTSDSVYAGTYNLFKYFNPVDLTGDGKVLIRPPMQSKNRAIDTEKELTASNEDISENVEYISFDIIVRSSQSSFRVGLTDNSYVVSAAEVYGEYEGAALDTAIAESPRSASIANKDATKLNTPFGSTGKIVRLSDYGSFSEDSVIGAVRVAFTPYTNTGVSHTNFFTDISETNLQSAPSLLWLPRSDIYLQNRYNIGVEQPDGWTLHDSGDSDWSTAHAYIDGVDSGMTYLEAASLHTYYDKTKFTGLSVAVADRYTTVSASDPDSILATDLTGDNHVIITPIYHDADYYYGKCRVNLWIEGCDAEARRAIDGGKFFFGFELHTM